MKKRVLEYVKHTSKDRPKDQPTVSDATCWNLFFDNNEGLYYAWRKALGMHGAAMVEQAQTVQLTRQVQAKLPKRTIKVIEDGREFDQHVEAEITAQVKAWINQQSGRFVKALTRRVREDERIEREETVQA